MPEIRKNLIRRCFKNVCPPPPQTCALKQFCWCSWSANGVSSVYRHVSEDPSQRQMKQVKTCLKKLFESDTVFLSCSEFNLPFLLIMAFFVKHLIFLSFCSVLYLSGVRGRYKYIYIHIYIALFGQVSAFLDCVGKPITFTPNQN